MKVDRSRDRPVRHLEWRVRLMAAGAVVALAGIYLDSAWMVNVAIGVLLVGFALRFAPEGGGPGTGGSTSESGPSDLAEPSDLVEPSDPGRDAEIDRV